MFEPIGVSLIVLASLGLTGGEATLVESSHAHYSIQDDRPVNLEVLGSVQLTPRWSVVFGAEHEGDRSMLGEGATRTFKIEGGWQGKVGVKLDF